MTPSHETRRCLDDYPEAMRVPEVAQFLRLSERTVRSLVANGTLPHLRMGRSIIIYREALREFLKGND